jgi:hypothetical protein
MENLSSRGGISDGGREEGEHEQCWWRDALLWPREKMGGSVGANRRLLIARLRMFAGREAPTVLFQDIAPNSSCPQQQRRRSQL